jgi:curved DNA-binding protein CbpA
MNDPYLILGVATDADDVAIEAAYLEGIRRCSPDRDPDRFEALRGAYERIRTRRDRLDYELFDQTPPTTSDVLNQATSVGQPRRPDRSLIAALLRGES